MGSYGVLISHNILMVMMDDGTSMSKGVVVHNSVTFMDIDVDWCN